MNGDRSGGAKLTCCWQYNLCKWPVWWDRAAKFMCVMRDSSTMLACCEQGQREGSWHDLAVSWSRAAESM